MKKSTVVLAKQKHDSYKYRNAVRKRLQLTPIIPYIEVHLADHCNLNCKGCSHFAPFANKAFADIIQYKKDIKQLSLLVSNVRKIRLLGGEPLLNPNITAFLSITRKYFPNSDIQIVSNGILLSRMNEEFWESCQQAKITIGLYIAPPFFEKQKKWTKIVKSHKVQVHVDRKGDFIDFIDIKGSSEQKENFERCRKRFPCFPMLKEGKLYNCFIPATIQSFNHKHGTNIPNTEYIDIHDPQINGWDILRQIESSTETCKYCTAGWKEVPKFKWAQDTRLYIKSQLAEGETELNEHPLTIKHS